MPEVALSQQSGCSQRRIHSFSRWPYEGPSRFGLRYRLGRAPVLLSWSLLFADQHRSRSVRGNPLQPYTRGQSADGAEIRKSAVRRPDRKHTDRALRLVQRIQEGTIRGERDVEVG